MSEIITCEYILPGSSRQNKYVLHYNIKFLLFSVLPNQSKMYSAPIKNIQIIFPLYKLLIQDRKSVQKCKKDSVAHTAIACTCTCRPPGPRTDFTMNMIQECKNNWSEPFTWEKFCMMGAQLTAQPRQRCREIPHDLDLWAPILRQVIAHHMKYILPNLDKILNKIAQYFNFVFLTSWTE